MNASSGCSDSRPAALPCTVIVVGLVSLFNNIASESVTPLIPILQTTTLAVGPLAPGSIKGLADTTTNLLKLWGGGRSDIAGRRREGHVLLGYTLSNLARPLREFSGGWLTVPGIRLTNRIGQGLRTARDAVLADAIRESTAVRACGFTRALDHAEPCSARSPRWCWSIGARNASNSGSRFPPCLLDSRCG